MTIKFLLTCTLISSMLLVTACNTVEGFGQDLQRGGSAITDAANKNKGDNKNVEE